MSVLACNRGNCGNIMCSKVSNEHGYICDECFDELVRTGAETNIRAFMQSEKTNACIEEAEARYKHVFRDQDED